MAFIRKYYTQQQIINGLFTSERQYMTTDGKEYKGPYHKYIDGLVLTGGIYNPDTSEQLIEFQENASEQSNFTYDNIKKTKKNIIQSPLPSYPRPTDNDYKNGYIVRYFINTRNGDHSTIVEIDSNQFSQIGTKIDKVLYFGMQLKWKLNGPQYDIVKDNIIQIPGVYDTNVRTVFAKDEEMNGISQFLTDPLEMTIYSSNFPEKYKGVQMNTVSNKVSVQIKPILKK